MARKFQHKRGPKSRLTKLSPAEMAFTDDEKKLYFGDGNENIRLLDQEDKTEITTQLAETERDVEMSKISTYANTAKPARKPVVTIRFDDGYTKDWTIVKPIAEEYGFPVTLAYISGEDNGMAKSQLTFEQMLYLQDSLGWECSAHTVSTNDLLVLSDEELRRQLKKCKDDLTKQGLDIQTVIYPMGKNDIRVRQMAKRFYRAGLGTEPGINTVPINQFNTMGVHIHDYNLDLLKTHVDNCVSSNGWLVLYGHSPSLTDSEIIKFRAILDYIKSKNIEFMTAKDALDYFENSIEIEGGTNGQRFAIGADGLPYSSKIDDLNHIYLRASYYVGNTLIKITNETPITHFQKKKVTSVSFGAGHGSNITIGNGAGTLVTYRINDDDVLNLQMFFPYSANLGMAFRYWTVSGWGAWRQHPLSSVQLVSQLTMNAFPSTTGHENYQNGITIFDVNSSGSTGFPASAGSVYTVKSNQAAQWTYQKFEGYQSNSVWKRYATNATEWSAWTKISSV